MLGWVVHRAHVQRDAVAAIQQAGGEVLYEWEWANGKRILRKTQPPWPPWLINWLGPDYFGNVVSVPV